MDDLRSRGMGWQHDLKDARDFRPENSAIRKLMERLGRNGKKRRAPKSIDLREYLPSVCDQGSLNSSTAFAVLALVGYFDGRANGRILDASTLFLYQISLKLLRFTGNASVDLRTTFKSLVRFGTPSAAYWPYEVDRFRLDPTDAFLFSFARDYETIQYFRLDAHDGEMTLRVVKSFLSAGFAIAFGFSVPSSVSAEAEIGYRPECDSIYGGQAVLAVGYDDNRRIASNTGALLFRNSWGTQWGEKGYGWLPYEFVINQFALDFWTAIRPDWIESGSFDLPSLKVKS